MQEQVGPISAAIVSFGYATNAGKRFLEGVDGGDAFVVVDVRTMLKVKAEGFSVKNSENGDFPAVQQAIFAHPKFVELQKELVYYLNTKAEVVTEENGSRHLKQLVGLGCTQGLHRADVTTKELCACLNRLETPHGERLFNALNFSILDWREVKRIVSDARQWLVKPWTMVEGGREIGKKQMYAYEACQRVEACAKSWDALYEFIEDTILLQTEVSLLQYNLLFILFYRPNDF